MKTRTLLTSIICLLVTAQTIAQDQVITLSGSYVVSKIEAVEESTAGFKANFLYEYTFDDAFYLGISIGYLQTEVTLNEGQANTTTFKGTHWPMYVAPKYMFLDPDSFRPYLKLGFGIHLTDMERNGPLGAGSDRGDAGFYGGFGAGVSKRLGGLISIMLEYELAYMANTWYNNGLLNTVTAGIGFNF